LHGQQSTTEHVEPQRNQFQDFLGGEQPVCFFISVQPRKSAAKKF